MPTRKNILLLKGSNVPGKIPSSGDLQLKELAINFADVILYASGTTSNSILPIGWDRVARTGDTMTGTLYAPSISATTFSGTGFYNNGIKLTDAIYDMKSNGVYEFSGITLASPTTFNVAPVKGWYVDNISSPSDPILTPVYFSGATGLTTPYLSSSTITYILLSSGGTLSYSPTLPTPTEQRQNIYLGKLGHANKTSLINAFNEPEVALSIGAQLRDMFTPINLINDGVYPTPNGTNLNFNISAGKIWGLGIGFTDNPYDPSSFTISGSSPTTFQYRTQTGGTATDVTLIDPTNYDVGGVITPVGGGSNNSTNQRIYLTQNGKVRIQYGQTIYASISAAIAGVQTESFVNFSNFNDNAILIAVLSVNRLATDLSDVNQAKFIWASKFGETAGGTGGISTTTLQQAYNNSTNPEIVTNITLDGVQFQGGTGSDSDANIVIENNAGVATGQWLANGGLSATTISATTYFGLPTDIRVTGGTYSNGTAIFTNNTGGTFSVTGFSTSTATAFTGGTVTGATNFTGGLTANTVSATTYYGDGSNLTGIVASWDGLQVITVGEDVVSGNLLFLSNDSKYYKVNNLAEASASTELRIAVTAITANSTGNGLVQGQFTTTGLTAGEKYWVGSSGNFTTTQPTADNSIVRFVGTALSTTKLEFNPDQTWIEISSVPATPSTGSTNPSVRSISTSQTALANDETIICLSALTITLPTAVGVAGKTYNIKSRTTGTITINSTGGQTFDDDTSLLITIKNTNITIQSDGSNWILI